MTSSLEGVVVPEPFGAVTIDATRMQASHVNRNIRCRFFINVNLIPDMLWDKIMISFNGGQIKAGQAGLISPYVVFLSEG